MKNKLMDLNNHLFEQLERLSDKEFISNDKLSEEIQRANAISQVAAKIIDTGRLALDVQKHLSEGLVRHVPDFLKIDQK